MIMHGVFHTFHYVGVFVPTATAYSACFRLKVSSLNIHIDANVYFMKVTVIYILFFFFLFLSIPPMFSYYIALLSCLYTYLIIQFCGVFLQTRNNIVNVLWVHIFTILSNKPDHAMCCLEENLVTHLSGVKVLRRLSNLACILFLVDHLVCLWYSFLFFFSPKL